MLNVSVVIPNYNYARYIKRRLDSIFNQTYPIYELIILDDNSSDNSIEIFEDKLAKIHKKYPSLKIKTIYNQKNSGNVCLQWQKGFQNATGDLIWIAEMDDLADPKFLQKVITPMQKDSDIVLSYSNSKIVTPEGKIVLKRTIRQLVDSLRTPQRLKSYIHDGKNELIKNGCIYNPIPNVSAVVFRRKTEIIDILNKSASFKIAGDWYLYVQLMLRGKIAYIPEKLNYYCIHTNSVTKTIDHQKYLEETQVIHRIINDLVIIPKNIQAKMIQHENYLKKRWHLSK